MMRFVAVFLAMAWALMGASSAFAANILTNPGFETGVLAPWFQDRNFGSFEPEDWHVTGADAHSGAFSATVVGNKELRQNFAPATTDDIIEISFWLKQPELGTEITFVSLFYSDGTLDSGTLSGAVPDPQGWVFLDATSLLDPGKNLIAFSAFGYEGGGPDENRTFLDDLRIESSARVPEPATLLLLGAGLAAFGAIGRRIRLSNRTR